MFDEDNEKRAEQQVKVHGCTRNAATDNARPTLFKLEKGEGWVCAVE